MFTPSKYQEAIFRFIESGHGNAVVNACPGSGKTTTLVHAAKLVEVESLFVAFNKHIAEELNRRLEGTSMKASTIHSLGLRSLNGSLGGRSQVDGRKYATLIRDYVKHNVEPDEREAAIDRLRKLVDFARLTLTNLDDPKAVAEMSWRYDVDYEESDIKMVKWLLREGEDIARKQGKIDFTDMIWLPSKWNVKIPQFAFVFVDEAQDLNRAQQEIVSRAVAPGGRVVAVGDRRQSIFGFAGADPESFDNLRTFFGATELPLSICYRCPRSHIELTKEIADEIEPRPDAPDGVVGTVVKSDLFKALKPGDMVLCRLTAPLVSTCLNLIRNGVHARVRGRDIGVGLGKIIRDVEKMKGYKWERFGYYLAQYRQIQERRLLDREASQAQIESLDDKVEAILACLDSSKADCAGDLAAYIEGLFSDDQPTVLLSTVHRAKGLENERVFILEPGKLPLRWPGQKPWEYEQELNIKWVALTRSTSELYFVE